jgi:hypothetical protein
MNISDAFADYADELIPFASGWLLTVRRERGRRLLDRWRNIAVAHR